MGRCSEEPMQLYQTAGIERRDAAPTTNPTTLLWEGHPCTVSHRFVTWTRGLQDAQENANTVATICCAPWPCPHGESCRNIHIVVRVDGAEVSLGTVEYSELVANQLQPTQQNGGGVPMPREEHRQLWFMRCARYDASTCRAGEKCCCVHVKRPPSLQPLSLPLPQPQLVVASPSLQPVARPISPVPPMLNMPVAPAIIFLVPASFAPPAPTPLTFELYPQLPCPLPAPNPAHGASTRVVIGQLPFGLDGSIVVWLAYRAGVNILRFWPHFDCDGKYDGLVQVETDRPDALREALHRRVWCDAQGVWSAPRTHVRLLDEKAAASPFIRNFPLPRHPVTCELARHR